MSRASIAQTMGWRLARVEKRLDELAEIASRAASAFTTLGEGLGAAAAAMESRFAAPRENPVVAEKPIAAGQALILRSWSVWGGGHASHGELADGRRVRIWTGEPKLSPGSRPKVEAMPDDAANAADFKWRAIMEIANA